MTAPPPRREVRVLADRGAVTRAGAEEWLARAREAVDDMGRFAVALAGGESQRALYALLADPAEPYRDALPWGETHVFFGDERCVPPGHPDSNYRMAREALLDRVPVPPAQIHRMRGEDAPDAAARAYEEALRAVLGPAPSLDLVLLGMGPDGHTASLFPGAAALEERRRLVVPAVAPPTSPVAQRITLTYAAVEAALAAVFLVAGEAKAAALARVLSGEPGAAPLPAARVRPRRGAALWLVDRAAAGRG